MEVRKVRDRGAICWKNDHHIFLTETLIGERVGLERIDDRWWCVYFAQFPIAFFDSQERRMMKRPESPAGS